MFLGLLDPDSLVRGTYSDPDPCIIKQKSKKILDSYCFVIYLSLFMLDIDVHVPKSNKQTWRLEIAGLEPDLDPEARILGYGSAKMSRIRNIDFFIFH
jgi:hypothetical protein